jgi:hypothetical protein
MVVRTMTPEELMAIPPEGPFPEGCVITDGTVWGRVLGRGSIKFGRRLLPCYRVMMLTGHERGAESIMPESEARLLGAR